MDIVTHILQIYKSCDPSNTDAVPASSLLNFIKPFMSNDLSELETLKVQLDPDGTDPPINSTFFHQVMSDWIAKINKQVCDSSLSGIVNSCIGVGEEAGLSSAQSTIFAVGLSPNMSNISNNSCINNNTIALEEQIQELQHQLHKALKELELIKQQLASSEEQNESLLVELNQLRKLHYREQLISEGNSKNKPESEEFEEKVKAANKKIQELGKALLDFEKENQVLQGQIIQLETENGCLKVKVQKLEKGKVERTKSIGELEEALDNKDSEIGTLLEVIDELKNKLEEKTELVNFYENENKLSKQKTEALENLLNDMFPDEVFTPKSSEANLCPLMYNSPKLINQLANPITPSMDSPINFKKCTTSSPIKNGNTSVDLFSNVGIVTVLRSPHKTLKEELSEITSSKSDENEVNRLKEILKEQEVIKNNLRENMKHLSHNNDVLQEYKQGYEELARSIQEKDEIIEHLKTKISTFKLEKSCTKEDKSTETEYCQERDELVQFINEELYEQNTIAAALTKNLEKKQISFKLDKSTETDGDQEKEQVIWNLRDEMKVLQEHLGLEKEKDAAFKKNEMFDKCTETNDGEVMWFVPLVEISESKKTNYAKQQMKLERLLEKQEKVEKDLNAERGMNRLLTLKVQELQEENTRTKENLEFTKDTCNKLKGNIKNLELEREKLQQDNLKLINEKFVVNQNLQEGLNKLAMEKVIAQGLQVEKEFLVNRIHQLEMATKQGCMKELSLKKQAIDLQAKHDLQILQLKKEISEKDNKLSEFQNQNTNIEWFLSGINNNLASITSRTLCQYEFDYEQDSKQSENKEMETEIENTSALIEEINKLNNNVRLIIYLFKIMEDKCPNTNVVSSQSFGGTYTTCNVSQPVSSSSVDDLTDSNIDNAAGSIEEEDSFMSCINELSDNDCYDVIPFKTDSFLDNLELNDADLRSLTRQDMEDKFTTLALTLTVDFTTSKRRYLNQKEKCNQLFMKFLTYLNHIANLVRQPKSKDEVKINNILELFKNINEELLISAFRCGVLQYEKRTVNCWNLVINYVAALSQENNQIKQLHTSDNETNQRAYENTNITKTLIPISLQNQITPTDKKECVIRPRSRSWKKLRYCVSTFFLIMLFLLVILLFYVDYLCLKYGKRVCPLEWLLSFVVRRVHSHQVL